MISNKIRNAFKRFKQPSADDTQQLQDTVQRQDHLIALLLDGWNVTSSGIYYPKH